MEQFKEDSSFDCLSSSVKRIFFVQSYEHISSAFIFPSVVGLQETLEFTVEIFWWTTEVLMVCCILLLLIGLIRYRLFLCLYWTSTWSIGVQPHYACSTLSSSMLEIRHIIRQFGIPAAVSSSSTHDPRLGVNSWSWWKQEIIKLARHTYVFCILHF